MNTPPEDRFRLRPVLRLRDGRLVEEAAPVVSEVPLTVFLNDREIITLLASEDALEYLAVGFLKSEGFLERREDFLGVDLDESRTRALVKTAHTDPLVEKILERRTVTSGCGKGTTFYHALDAMQVRTAQEGPAIAAPRIRTLMGELHARSKLYRAAGGVHNAALCSAKGIALFRDDIGRHNALDKIHGECFLRGIKTSDKLLVSTGRVSSEILIKTGKMGVPIVVSRSSPTLLALELAERLGITVVGLVRGGSLTVYTRPERVTI